MDFEIDLRTSFHFLVNFLKIIVSFMSHFEYSITQDKLYHQVSKETLTTYSGTWSSILLISSKMGV